MRTTILSCAVVGARWEPRTALTMSPWSLADPMERQPDRLSRRVATQGADLHYFGADGPLPALAEIAVEYIEPSIELCRERYGHG